MRPNVVTRTGSKEQEEKGPLLTCLETFYMALFNDVHLLSVFYVITSKISCFLQIFIFCPLFNVPVWWWPIAVVAGTLFWYLLFISTGCAHTVKQNLSCASWRLTVSVCYLCKRNTWKVEYIKLAKCEQPSIASNFVTANDCQPQANYLAKIFQTLVKRL